MGDTGADIMEPLTGWHVSVGPQDKKILGADNASGNVSGGTSGKSRQFLWAQTASSKGASVGNYCWHFVACRRASGRAYCRV